MKKLIFILFTIVFISCKTDKNEFIELNEKDAYLLMNEYLIKDISEKNRTTVLYEYQLNIPSITVKDVDDVKKEVFFPESIIDERFVEDVDVSDIEMEQPVFLERAEKFTTKKWNQEKLAKISFLKKSHEEKVNYKTSLMDILKSDGIIWVTQIHNVSYPIFYPKEKMAIIYDEPYYIDGMNCLQQTNYYIYIKEKNGWRSLKEYGVTGIYGTLYNYYKDLDSQSTHKPSK
ncbi:MAG: hypothetical protein L3J14_00920 [Flavobacteriaceae bacterium]|nr:hypothetical protein [Flavobacteriaceae bacterium]